MPQRAVLTTLEDRIEQMRPLLDDAPLPASAALLLKRWREEQMTHGEIVDAIQTVFGERTSQSTVRNMLTTADNELAAA